MAERVECAVIGAGVAGLAVARRLAMSGREVVVLEAEEAFGHYYTLSGAPPFRRLIYPVARQDWLGVHVTIDLGGQVKFGPDFAWIDGVAGLVNLYGIESPGLTSSLAIADHVASRVER